MSVASIIESSYSNLIDRVQENVRFSTLIPRIGVNLNKVAIPAIFLFACSYVQAAEAGPVTYGVCVSACIALVTPIFTPACIAACMATAVIPCP